MSRRICGGLASLVLPVILWCADNLARTMVVNAEPISGPGQTQQLSLKGVRAIGAQGVRVYLEPLPSETAQSIRSQPNDGARVATLFFSESSSAEKKQNFVVTLIGRFSGRTRLVLIPIAAPSDHATTTVELDSAAITLSQR